MEINNKLAVNNLLAKFKSKTELYNVLTREGNIYLPPKQDSTQQFFKHNALSQAVCKVRGCKCHQDASIQRGLR